MPELWISASGEVKLEYDVVGQITWTTPIAHLWVVGEWSAADSYCGNWGCDCGIDEDELDDLQSERDGLAHDLSVAREKIATLEAEMAQLKTTGSAS